MIPSERIDMLPNQRRDIAEGFVVDLMPFSPELADDLPDLNHVPGNNRVVKNR